jgi:hypothetical protein
MNPIEDFGHTYVEQQTAVVANLFTDVIVATVCPLGQSADPVHMFWPFLNMYDEGGGAVHPGAKQVLIWGMVASITLVYAPATK